MRPILLSVVLVGGCSAEAPPPPAKSALENQAAPAAAPAAPAPAAAIPTTAMPLTAEGWGPLLIGMRLRDVTAALGPDADPQAVGGPEPETCDQFRPARAPAGMLVMIENGRLTRISLVDEAQVRTDGGIGLGQPVAAVEAAYGARAAREAHEYQEAPAAYLTVWSGGRPSALYVQDPLARGIRYEIGSGGRVEAIHAGGPSIQYVEGCA